MEPEVANAARQADARLAVGLRRAYLVCMALTLALGFVKLQYQRSHPPDWVRDYHRYEGYVSIDDYALRAEHVRDWLRGDPDEPAGLVDSLRTRLHPTALLVPGLVALTSFVLPSIPLSFAAWAALALILNALVVQRIAARLLPESRAAPWLAGLLFVGHNLVQREACQLHLDVFASLWTSLVVLLSLRIVQGEGRDAALVGLFVLCVSGVLIKVSLLPILVLPAAILLFEGGPFDARTAFAALILYGLAPLAGWVGLHWAIGGRELVLGDFRHLGASVFQRHLASFAFEMALLLQAFPLLALRRSPVWPAERPVAVALTIVLLATWGNRLPPIPRIYLPAVGLLVALAVPRLLGWLSPRALWLLLAVYLATNYAATLVGFLAQ